jgi:C4-dicarboxylate-specific signal transduction histidine kinase
MGELTASIAHEVNQPLTSIMTSGDSLAAWLANEPPNLEKAGAAANRMVQAATRASEIVQRIRATFKKGTSTTGSVDLNEVIQETIPFVHGEAQRKNVSLRAELHPGIPCVNGDRVQLQQVLLNLMMNAIEAMAGPDIETKRLLIRSGVPNPSELLISIVDTGPGIDAELASRLFIPFVTTKPQGIGMGLRISRSIIEAHGGRLWAEKNEPRGAVFHFTLPIQAVSE